MGLFPSPIEARGGGRFARRITCVRAIRSAAIAKSRPIATPWSVPSNRSSFVPARAGRRTKSFDRPKIVAGREQLGRRSSRFRGSWRNE
jgi:hypothetical protein